MRLARRPAVHWIRRLVQFGFLGFFAFLAWAASYPATGSENLFLRIDPLTGFTAARNGTWLYLIPAWILLGLTLVSGRFFCAWICPLGTCLELIPSFADRRRRSMPALRGKSVAGKKIGPDDIRFRLKYLFLAILMLLFATGVNIVWIFDPLVIANRAVVLVSFGSVPFILIALAVLALVAGPRFWCQEMCPLGAGLSFVAWLGSRLPSVGSPLALIKDEDRCTHCGRCAQACPFSITLVADSRKAGRLAIADCALCAECVAACPEAGALNLGIMGARVLGTKRPPQGAEMEEAATCGN